MIVYDKIPSCFDGKKRVVVLGLFDGVHIGHRYLIREARKIADDAELSLAVFTFYSEDTLPKGKERLYTTEQKLSLLSSLAVDEVFLSRFADVADTEPDKFVSSVLINSMGAEIAVCGEDFRFGKGAFGDASMLSSLMSDKGRRGVAVPDMKYDGKKISTADIKVKLLDGRVSDAAKILFEPYFMTAKVIHGDGRGRALGLPTINTECVGFCENLPRGVYKTEAVIDNKIYKAITNIGVCPTFKERKVHTETFILDYSGELYGESVTLRFLDFIRKEEQFPSKEALILQINSDIERAWNKNGR